MWVILDCSKEYKSNQVALCGLFSTSKEYKNASVATEYKSNQVALCGLFSTVVKNTKMHQWRHMQDEINSLHKLDKHYYGLFGFMLLNEKISG